jgi:hypothetical protein
MPACHKVYCGFAKVTRENAVMVRQNRGEPWVAAGAKIHERRKNRADRIFLLHTVF